MPHEPRVALGAYPSPVERISDASDVSRAKPTLWIKRDDLTNELYGGNKVRKLELLLGAARESGRTRLLTVGAVGSHQVVATAIHGKRAGFEVEAVLVPQPASAHAELNVRVALAEGLRFTTCPAWSLAPAVVATRWGRDAYFIPLGGSNALGSIGFVEAAAELAAQVRAGVLDEPDLVVVATGSGGTAAGLAVGFERAQLRTRVIGVAVAPPTPVLRHLARRLAQKTAAAVGLGRAVGLRAAARIDVVGQWIGRGYGHPTPDGSAATEVARAAGITLDPTYTAKAFACALAHVARADVRNVLYWHTLSTAPLVPLLGAGPREPLPRSLARLLR